MSYLQTINGQLGGENFAGQFNFKKLKLWAVLIQYSFWNFQSQEMFSYNPDS